MGLCAHVTSLAICKMGPRLTLPSSQGSCAGARRESVGSYPSTSSHQKGAHTREASWEGEVGDDKVGGGTFIPGGARTFISFPVGASIPSPVK